MRNYRFIFCLVISIVVFIYFFIPCFASEYTGNFVTGWGPYVSISEDYDIYNSLHVSASAYFTFTCSGPTSYNAPNAQCGIEVHFYDENYNQIYWETLSSYSFSLFTTIANYSRTCTASRDYTNDDFDLKSCAYVRFYAYRSPQNYNSGNGVLANSALGSSSWNIATDGRARTVIDAVDEQTDVIKEQRQEEIDKGNEASSDASSAVDTLSSDIMSKWEILWYPITFTGNLLDVFVNGTSGSATYSARYGTVTGYSYDSSTGLLVPVYSKTRDAPLSGTVITFPEYTLPVLDVKLWDSYSYDISTLRSNYSGLFSALDVIITILEVIWLIGFLRDKYLEVFAG